MTPTVRPQRSLEAPQRFKPPRSTVFIDRCMTYFITIGGIAVVVAVLGIFVFILSQILPLFRGAHIQPLTSVPLPHQPYVLFGVDEWTELPFVITADGTLTFVDLQGKQGVQTPDPGFAAAKTFTAYAYNQARQ
ncbi:MAG: hypothetical protein FJZ47_11955, partial [Candidatus Tectomicrobia bacterium]|nr:hypothetical protein [Candidatus Tectomicrobia bacterium]